MLTALSIRDFVIVDHLELDLASGFSVLTGETGAGKSILIDALALTLGARADAAVVKEGANKTDITATFDVTPEIFAWLQEQSLAENDQEVMLRRVIDQAGRSKAFINGISVTVTQLRTIGELLVDIHGQHAHQSLLKTDAQRLLLDNQAGLLDAAREVASAYSTWHAVVKQRTLLERDARHIEAEKEQLTWSVEELKQLNLRAGEWEEINQEHRRLSHGASLLSGAQEALVILSDSDVPVLKQLAVLNQKLDKLADIDAELKPILDMLEPARIQIQEAVYTLNDYVGSMEFDAERLAQVDERLQTLYSAARKYHVEPEDLPDEYTRSSAQLAALNEVNDLAHLAEQEAKAQQHFMKLAEALSKKRHVAAKKFAQTVTSAMQDLSMQGGKFDIVFTPCAPASFGIEDIEFLVSGHQGVTPKPLAKVASGGELARIALAISVMASTSTATPTLIFDEVDSGVGGAVAEVVGKLLKQLGHDRQVLCVTHLPQVASQADHHFKVKKVQDHGHTTSHIVPLTESERIEEIARMLGGLEITDITRQHARELLTAD